MQVTYRKPRREDFARLAEIYNYAVRETAATFDTTERDPDYYEPFLEDEVNYRMTVAESGSGDVIAYAGTYPFSQRAAYGQLGQAMLYVHPEWQRQGIGSTLLKEIHNNDLLKGLHTVIALINKDNAHARRSFERLGYICKGELTEVGFKFGKRHSVVIYQRHVVQSEEISDGA